MDFAYSQEQRMLTDSLRRVMSEGWTFDKRRTRFAQGKLDRDAWMSLAELGVTGLMVPQAYGGFGESTATMLAVHQELGRGIVSEPVIASAVMAVTLLAEIESEPIKSKWLAAHADGEAIMTVAWQEGGERYSQTPTLTQATAKGDGFVLTGQKRHVWYGADADAMIVTADLDGQPALFLVPAQTLGVTVTDFPTFDLSRCANVSFEGVALDSEALLAKGDLAQAIFDKSFDFGVTALCAHACGAMQYLIEVTSNYLKTRKQFGQALINFQVLQHRLADMLIQQEMAMSNAYVAAIALVQESAAMRAKRVSMAQTEVAKAARFVGEQAVQLHGGMGVTDELEVGDYFKRLAYVDVILGDKNFHLQRAQALTLA
jgi:alkylation response protein AidB-like acyl-CoA dehydrogenase